jgi:hypothetical protein
MAIANQQLKDYNTAIPLYERMNTAEAHNNLATIYMKQNKKGKAIEELKKALSIRKFMLEAKYNLAMLDKKAKFPQKDERAELYQKYSPTTPMIALPAEKYYRKTFYSGFNINNFNPVNIILFNKFLRGTDNAVIEFTKLITPVFIIFTVVLMLVLLSVFIPQTIVNSSNHTYSRRFFGLFVPGISYNWKLLGPSIFAVWLAMGITNMFFYGYSFESARPALGLMTTFALPNYSIMSPVSSTDLPYSHEIGFITSLIFVVIWIFNFFYVLISRRFVLD